MDSRMDEAGRYIAMVRWKYAATMPDWLHEYTVKHWQPELAEQFEVFCSLIRRDGFVEPWPAPPRAAIYHSHYLVIDGYKYLGHGTARRPGSAGRHDCDQPCDVSATSRAPAKRHGGHKLAPQEQRKPRSSVAQRHRHRYQLTRIS